MDLTRRTLLGMLTTAPLAAVAGGCCRSQYPKPAIGPDNPLPPASSILRAAKKEARDAMAAGATRVVDVHAHFFNASDVPVRGFVAESLGHNAPQPIQFLLRALSPIADRIAANAPTVTDELKMVRRLLEAAGPAAAASADPGPIVGNVMEVEAKETARRVAEATRNSEFQRRYRELKQRSGPGAASTQPPSSPLSPNEVYDVVMAARTPATPQASAAVVRAAAASEDEKSDAADGVLGFLFYMLSHRSSNLDAYMNTFARHERAFGVDTVLGALVDFDYWLDCPPLSAHVDQIELHALLSQMSGKYMRPIVAYNPWTDINQDGACLKRVVRAVKTQGFVGVKIYPPTGFRPTANATTATQTSKRRPDLKKLDDCLTHFFDTCAKEQIPVLAHANRSNGRDIAHDDFSRPEGWRALLERYASKTDMPVIDVGHFGGTSAGILWTRDFAKLMADMPKASLYGDLGYWDELMCPGTPDQICENARKRLKDVLTTVIDPAGNTTVADRVMFATDWLMLSQVKHWADYPARLFESVKEIARDDVDKIFGGNAAKCFRV
jgi:predicted TIM-barrel fold metal-dependent hydrolase